MWASTRAAFRGTPSCDVDDIRTSKKLSFKFSTSIYRSTPSLVDSPLRPLRRTLLITRKISPFRKSGLLPSLESLRARMKSNSEVGTLGAGFGLFETPSSM